VTAKCFAFVLGRALVSMLGLLNGWNVMAGKASDLVASFVVFDITLAGVLI
jgi:hypothetical protein